MLLGHYLLGLGSIVGQKCGRSLGFCTVLQGSLNLPHAVHQIWGAQRKFRVGSGSL